MIQKFSENFIRPTIDSILNLWTFTKEPIKYLCEIFKKKKKIQYLCKIFKKYNEYNRVFLLILSRDRYRFKLNVTHYYRFSPSLSI